MSVFQNVGGTIKTLGPIHQNVGGTLKEFNKMHQNVGGALKEIYGGSWDDAHDIVWESVTPGLYSESDWTSGDGDGINVFTFRWCKSNIADASASNPLNPECDSFSDNFYYGVKTKYPLRLQAGTKLSIVVYNRAAGTFGTVSINDHIGLYKANYVNYYTIYLNNDGDYHIMLSAYQGGTYTYNTPAGDVTTTLPYKFVAMSNAFVRIITPDLEVYNDTIYDPDIYI